MNLSLPLLENITWQYDTADTTVSLIEQKNQWYASNWEAFWLDWYESVFNLKTANRFGCVVWAIILNIPTSWVYNGDLPPLPFGFGPFRQNFTPPSNFYTGIVETPTLELEEARRLLRVRYYAQTMSPTVSNINLMLKDVFGELGLAYIEETVGGQAVVPFGFGPFRQNFAHPANFNTDPNFINIAPMRHKYIFTFPISANFQQALQQYLPRGAGVRTIIQTP